MGAMLLYKKETGKEATEAKFDSMTDTAVLLWAAAASHSEVMGKEFNYTPQQFANRLTASELLKWVNYQRDQLTKSSGTDSGESKKKSRRVSLSS